MAQVKSQAGLSGWIRRAFRSEKEPPRVSPSMMRVWWTSGWLVAASVAILPIWGASALAMWGIDKLRREEVTVKAGYRWEMAPLWPGSADIPLDETTEHLLRRWASTGKRITVSTRLTDNS